ncbi:MAG: DUF3326 domain-containing protein [Deltaproteobacteria bacterium]|nr:DUF3326 domain-containing protein [Deltaproteobacteria bacterium]
MKQEIIRQTEYIIHKSRLKGIKNLPAALEHKFGSSILRWFVSKVIEDTIHIELTLWETEANKFSGNISETFFPGNTAILNIIPTGIGCDIGGYAGDAAPANCLLASCADYVITNPNTVNGSNFISITDNTLYVEGYLIDLFCQGTINLYAPYSNHIGLIIEKTSEENIETVLNIANAVRAVHGINIEHHVVTDELIGGRCVQNKSGAYVGNVDNPRTLFKACETLIKKRVNAIAVTSNIKDLPLDNYARHFQGAHPNPIGGTEAIISHLICKKYKLPAAHAPMINVKRLDLASNIVDARSAGEFASTSGIACAMIGLKKSPQIHLNCRIKNIFNINNLLAIVAPATALGGIPMIYAQIHDIPIIAVANNKSILNVGKSHLDLKNVYEVGNYFEAAGVIQALKSGLNISSIYRPIPTLRD